MSENTYIQVASHNLSKTEMTTVVTDVEIDAIDAVVGNIVDANMEDDERSCTGQADSDEEDPEMVECPKCNTATHVSKLKCSGAGCDYKFEFTRSGHMKDGFVVDEDEVEFASDSDMEEEEYPDSEESSATSCDSDEESESESDCDYDEDDDEDEDVHASDVDDDDEDDFMHEDDDEADC